MPDAGTPPERLEHPGYEIFILALSVLSLVNLVLLLPFFPLGGQQQDAIFILDGVLTLVFLGDFTFRLFRADSKRGYFFHDRGWLDLIGSLPALRIFRIFRVFRVGRLVRAYGFGALGRWLVRERAQSALYVVIFLVVVVLEVSSILILPLEQRSPDANITTAGDALWWGIVTVTTVGYGDQYPVTTGGRVVGVFVLILGVGLFGTFTGFLANAFLARPTEQSVDSAPARAAAGSPRALIEEVRRELEAQETRSASLRSRLEELETAL
jgi:voltage-gated potassium channel